MVGARPRGVTSNTVFEDTNIFTRSTAVHHVRDVVVTVRSSCIFTLFQNIYVILAIALLTLIISEGGGFRILNSL
jgi:hypothetical protein